MDYILDVYLCGLVALGKLLGAIGFAIVIQFIGYQVFGFNLFKKIDRRLTRLDRYFNKIF